MFDKLKKKFILINMSLLTMVFVLIFGTIYITTSISMEKDLEHELKSTISNPRKPGPNFKMMSSSIIIELDSNNNIAKVTSYIEIDEDILQDAINTIIKNENNLDKIKIEGSSYGYLKEYTLKGLKIALISREPQINVLNNLLKVFIGIGSISLILLLFISIYLTNKTIKPIKESFEKQKEFIANASHELKTPLTIIRTNTSLVLSNSSETVGSQSKWLNYINNQIERMSKLIDEMLSLAKLDTGKELEEFIVFDISKLINNVLLTFEAVLFENNIELSSNIEEDITIKGDRESIKKVFIILLDNAIKYTNKNGKIDVELNKDKNKIKLKIKNTGEGIKKEDLDKIFERFYRLDTSRARDTGGYGLGLSIAKSIVESHNGKIYAESNIGKDTTFIIEFNI
ncbi:MAG: HAMP domain-containing histidine kinase [Clostridium sp.]|uniref:sensor histidine kinase n=1 Tax=Clostridium sp. TaxID=1506 RepID=UPI0025E1DF9A|nr:HAMP domain-containing sensor histidine kinase [Clostridium sp.]MCI6693923.1 HAMP domain-containing histidine kinase [Clostridium sp.]MDY2629869.1 HAMP domain-containing sensor histidine kinase [Clostridium sp.]